MNSYCEGQILLLEIVSLDCVGVISDAQGWPRLKGDFLQSCKASDPVAEIQSFAVCLLRSIPGYSVLPSTTLVPAQMSMPLRNDLVQE